jgi:uncharacterized tellurite resistance protein B-like protein
MKKWFFYTALLVVLLTGRSFGEKAVIDSNVVAYCAGISVIAADTSIGRKEMARRYRLLCRLTHTSKERVLIYLKQFKNNPTDWQKFQASVLEILQKKG